MTNTEKQLLMADLCARLPYGVIINYFNISQNSNVDAEVIGYSNGFIDIDNHSLNPEFVKPYLRPMSSMTEEEREEYKASMKREQIVNVAFYYPTHESYDWLNKKGFDYRGLIPMGLAIEAPEGMY